MAGFFIGFLFNQRVYAQVNTDFSVTSSIIKPIPSNICYVGNVQGRSRCASRGASGIKKSVG